MEIVIFIGLLVVVVAFIAFRFNRYTSTYDKKIIAHYEAIGYTVTSIENPKGFDVKNPFLIEVNSPVLLIDGIGPITNCITVVKRLVMLKDEKQLIVWVRLTVKAKDFEFESRPNIEV